MRYDVTEMRPIGRRLWSARVSIENPENVEGHDVFQNCELHIRFSATEAETAERLLTKIHGEAERILLAAVAVVQSTSAADHLVALQEESDGWGARPADSASVTETAL
jgi:hypothetical protein